MAKIRCLLAAGGALLAAIACDDTSPTGSSSMSTGGSIPVGGKASAGQAGNSSVTLRPGAGASQSGVGDVQVPPATPVPEDSLPEAMARAWCEGLLACCSAWGLGLDLGDCTNLFRAGMQAKIDRPLAVEYDPEAAGQCVALIRGGFTACRGFDPDPCQKMFVPTLAPGAVCQENDECIAPPGGYANCHQDYAALAAGGAGSLPELCVVSPPEPHGAEGDACVRVCLLGPSGEGCVEDYSLYGSLAGQPPAPNQGCQYEDGLYCEPSSVTCQRLLPAGSPCNGGPKCQQGTYCSGVCTPFGSSGDPCTESQPCGPGLYCTCSPSCTRAGVCAPKAAEGEPCDNPDQCQGRCRYQPTADGTLAGICVAGNSFVPTLALCSTYVFSST